MIRTSTSILIVAAALAGCATQGGGSASYKTVGGAVLGTGIERPITLSESRIALPSKPEVKIIQSVARTLQNGRIQEEHFFDGGWARFEQQPGSFLEAHSTSDATFRNLFRGAAYGNQPLPWDKLEVKRTPYIAYATFTHVGRPCLAFILGLGDKTPTGYTQASIKGLYCGPSSSTKEAVAADTLSFLDRIRLKS